VPDLRVNGSVYGVDAPVGASLADVLREELGFTGTKIACHEGHCGACTVLVDGTPVLSCITLAHRVEGEVTTIEGLRDHPMIDSFVRADAMQCGFCTPGMVMSCAALVDRNPYCTRDEVKAAISGHLCRCGAYPNIFNAALAAAARMQTGHAGKERKA
jgi:carbon-monoxide dehydrogenase small subunit/xanthine dehydrogenase YagT iron-sulfur-binding subunit